MAKALTAAESQYVNWLLLTDAQRLATGLPSTQAEWGALHGVPTRTLRSWILKTHVAEELATRRRQLAAQVGGDASVPLAGAGVSPEMLLAGMAATVQDGAGDPAAEFAAARQMLLGLVSKGDKSALELWFKTFGKPYVEAEQAAFKSDFRDLGTDELHDKILALLPDDALHAELARRAERAAA